MLWRRHSPTFQTYYTVDSFNVKEKLIFHNVCIIVICGTN